MWQWPPPTTFWNLPGGVICSWLTGSSGVWLPGLQAELLDYIEQEHIRSGPVFLIRNRTPIPHNQVAFAIQCLAQDVRVASEKCNSRCLRKLRQEIQAGIRANVELLAEQPPQQMAQAARERLIQSLSRPQ